MLTLYGIDDFDDFQSAPAVVSPTQTSVPPKSNVFEFLAAGQGNKTVTPIQPQPSAYAAQRFSTPSAPILQSPTVPTPLSPTVATPQSGFSGFSQQPLRPNYMNTGSSFSTPVTSASPPIPQAKSAFTSPPTTTTKSGGGNFDDLWSMGLGSTGTAKTSANANSNAGKSIKDIEKEKAQAAIWGSQATQKPNAFATFGSGGFAGGSSTSGASGGDDLLL